MLVELGNDRPEDSVTIVDPDTGIASVVRSPGAYPCVAYINIPEGPVGRSVSLEPLPGESEEAFAARDAADIAEHDASTPQLYSQEDFDDDVFGGHPATVHIADALSGIDDPTAKSAVRRALIDGQFADASGVKGFPNHEAFTTVAHPQGFWRAISAPGSKPSWVRVADHPGLEAMLADYYDCPIGAPDHLEDLYQTRYGSSTYPPGAAPDPLSGFTALHTTFGRLNQSLVMAGYGYIGTVGTATASSATTLTGSTETGVTHTLNDCAGNYLVVGPNASGTGSKVYGLIVSNTTGTTPVYTVDRWYDPATPGGAAGTTPNATSFYTVSGGPAAQFVALSSDTTAKSLAGTGGTQDAATISQTLTNEFSTASSGLLRKIAPIGNSGATFTMTPVFTATATDNGLGAQTVGTAAASPSMVRTVGALTYMTLVSPTATLTATGDQLTLTWTFTMT